MRILPKRNDGRNANRMRRFLGVGFALSIIIFWSSGYKDAVVWGLFLFLIVGSIRRKSLYFAKGRFTIPVLLFLGVAFLSACFSAHPWLGIRDFVKLIELAAVYFVIAGLVRNTRHLESVVFSLVCAFAIVLLYDTVRYLLFLGDKWMWGQRWYESSLGLSTLASGVIATIIPLSVMFIFSHQRRESRICAAAVVAFGIFQLVILQTRSAYVALVASVSIPTFVDFKSRIARLALFLGIICIVCAGYEYVSLNRSRSSGWARVDLWKTTFEQALRHPVFGNGYGPKIFNKWYQTRKLEEWMAKTPGHPHNMLLQIFFEMGVTGLVVFIYLWVVIFKELIGKIRDRAAGGFRPYFAGLLLAFCSFLIYGQFSLALGGRPALLMWVLIGLTSAGIKICGTA
jgi:O-antigen ligase